MIPETLVRELRYVEIATARKMRTMRVGPFMSRRRGDGFDFDQLEPYQPGDDVRRIDWNVTAVSTPRSFVRHTPSASSMSSSSQTCPVRWISARRTARNTKP